MRSGFSVPTEDHARHAMPSPRGSLDLESPLILSRNNSLTDALRKLLTIPAFDEETPGNDAFRMVMRDQFLRSADMEGARVKVVVRTITILAMPYSKM